MLDDLQFTQNVAGQENKCNNKSKKEKNKVKKNRQHKQLQ